MTRTVTVFLKAVNSQFDDSYKKSSEKSKGLGDQVKKTSAQNKQAMEDLGRASVVMGAGLLAGFGMAVKASASFEKQMSGVKAVSNATAADMKKLSAAALKAGKDTAFSASDAARAEAELTKAGISTADVLGGALTGSLSLAAAGQLELADAATISAQAMNIFKLGGKDVGHIADVMAAGANKSAADVKDLGDALRQGGLVAAQTGLSLEDTVGALAAFADRALIGSDAGTSLKTMLQRLTPQSAEASDMMDALGISAFDAQGNFVGLATYSQNLQDSLSTLTPEARASAMSVLFGSDAVRGANVLYELGAAGVRDYTEAVNDNGAAQRMAATQMDNLAGDIEQLKGSIETGLIMGGTTANGVMREMTQATTGLVNAYISLPAPLQGAVTGLAGVTGAAALTGGAALLLIPKIAAVDAALETLTGRSGMAKAALVGVGRAMGVAGAGAAAIYGLVEAVDFLTDKLRATPPTIDALSEGLIRFNQTGKPSGELLKVLGENLDALPGKVALANRGFWTLDPAAKWNVDGAKDDLKALDGALADLVSGGRADLAINKFADIQNRLAMSGVTPETIRSTFRAYYEALDAASLSAQKASAPIGGVASQMQAQAEATRAANDALQAHSDALKALTDPVFAMQSALSQQAQAEKDLIEARKSGKATAQDLEDRLFALARANVDVSSASDKLTASMGDGGVAAAQMSGQLRTWVAQGLLTQAQADQLNPKIQGLTDKAKKLSSTPASVAVSTTGVPKTQAELDRVFQAGRKAATPVLVPIQLTNVGQFLATLSQARGAVQATIPSGPGTNLLLPRGLNLPKKRDGGLVLGPGTGTSDSILTRLSNREFVVNAEATARNLPFLEALNGGKIPGLRNGGRLGIPAAPGYNAASPLSQQALGMAARGGSVESIRALVSAYDDYLKRLDQAAQREGLLQAIHDAQVNASKAKAKERGDALRQVADAQKALQRFDAAAYADSQKAATDRLIASLEKEAEKRQHLIDIRDNMFAVGKLSAAAEVAGLTKQMAALEKYSNEWTSLYQKRQQILDDEKAKLKAVADAAKSAYEDQLDAVNRMLDAQDQVQGKIADSKASYAKRQSDLLGQQGKAEREFYAGLTKAAADHAAAEQRILTDRRDNLADLLDPSKILDFQRGIPAGWLVANAQGQLDALQQWADALQAARGRGVSEQVISALGLDQGPQTLYQVKALTSATAAEIDQLNAAVAQRTVIAGEQVRREQVGNYGQLGAALIAEQQQYAQAVASLQDGFRSQQADLAQQLQDAQAAFTAEQTDLAAELAAIGTDQGRSYGEALAAGLASQIPAVKAAADALAAAAAGAKVAAPGVAAAGAPPKGTAGTMMVNGQLVHVNPAGIIDTRGAYYGQYPSKVKTATFDTGGLLQPGFTLAFNGTGAPERVMTRQQEQSSGGQIVQFQPYAQNVIREQVDMDLLMRRAEFLVTTGSF